MSNALYHELNDFLSMLKEDIQSLELGFSSPYTTKEMLQNYANDYENLLRNFGILDAKHKNLN